MIKSDHWKYTRDNNMCMDILEYDYTGNSVTWYTVSIAI